MTSDGIPEERRPPAVVAVVQDRWSLELRGDELAEIRYDGVRLLRAVRAVVRDESWRTIVATVVERRLWSHPAGWSADLDLHFDRPREEGLVDYHAHLAITLDSDELTVTFTGTSRAPFRRNRIGLVALHPVTEAGRPVEVVHTDDSVVPSLWPEAISPHQPFCDVDGFRWERAGVRAELSFTGDVFETEDQRNWTDASFKTYGTPLALPFPVEVGAGDEVVQKVRLHVTGRSAQVRASGAAAASPAVLVLDEVRGAVPALSLGATTSGDPVPAWADPGSGFEAVLVELAGPVSGWPDALAAAAREAEALGAFLDVRIAASLPADVGSALRMLAPFRVGRLGVFDAVDHVTTRPLWDALAAGTHADVALVAGARSHFAELNRRHRDLPADAPALTCSITPQMHATELPHIVDNLVGQEAVSREAVRLAGARPVQLGPVTLRPRFNAVATGDDCRTGAPDPLQGTGFTAAWTLGSVSAVTRPGVEGLCFYEVTGPGGIGGVGGLHPVGELLTTLAPLRGHDVLTARAPSGVAAYPVRTPEGVRVLLGRLGDTPLTCQVSGPGGTHGSVLLEPWSATEVRLS